MVSLASAPGGMTTSPFVSLCHSCVARGGVAAGNGSGTAGCITRGPWESGRKEEAGAVVPETASLVVEGAAAALAAAAAAAVAAAIAIAESAVGKG